MWKKYVVVGAGFFLFSSIISESEARDIRVGGGSIALAPGEHQVRCRNPDLVDILGFDNDTNCGTVFDGEINRSTNVAQFNLPSGTPFAEEISGLDFNSSPKVCLPSGWMNPPSAGSFEYFEHPNIMPHPVFPWINVRVGVMFTLYHEVGFDPPACGGGNSGYGFWYLCVDAVGGSGPAGVGGAEGPYYGTCQ